MILLSDKIEFPSITNTTPEGIIAIGGDLKPERLLLAYKTGIFPWYEDGSAILWWCPDPRMVLFPDRLKVSKSMKQVLKKGTFKVTFNKAFKDVIGHCADIDRNGQDGTWITEEMKRAYIGLHKQGIAKSVEVWRDNKLVGGLYGIDLGYVFCGESMFALESNASKVAFITWVKHLQEQNYKLIDCQVYTDHLASLGAEEIPREVFLSYLY